MLKDLLGVRRIVCYNNLSLTASSIYMNAIGVKPPEDPGKFIVKLSEASIPTRYPEDLAKIQMEYTAEIVRDILAEGKEVITWIKEQL